MNREDIFGMELAEISDEQLIDVITGTLSTLTVAAIVDGLRGAEKRRVLAAIEAALRRMV